MPSPLNTPTTETVPIEAMFDNASDTEMEMSLDLRNHCGGHAHQKQQHNNPSFSLRESLNSGRNPLKQQLSMDGGDPFVSDNDNQDQFEDQSSPKKSKTNDTRLFEMAPNNGGANFRQGHVKPNLKLSLTSSSSSSSFSSSISDCSSSSSLSSSLPGPHNYSTYPESNKINPPFHHQPQQQHHHQQQQQPQYPFQPTVNPLGSLPHNLGVNLNQQAFSVPAVVPIPPLDSLQSTTSIKYRRTKLNLNLLPLNGPGSETTGSNCLLSPNSGSIPTTQPLLLPQSTTIEPPFNIPLGGATEQRKRPIYNFYLNQINFFNMIDAVQFDWKIPLEKQGWFHGFISRIDAELLLETARVGSYLVRKCDQWKKVYSLALKSLRGYMHIRIYQNEDSGKYTLGVNGSVTFASASCNGSGQQFWQRPLCYFDSIPELIHHFTRNTLPISGAEHMSLIYPVIDQLL